MTIKTLNIIVKDTPIFVLLGPVRDQVIVYGTFDSSTLNIHGFTDGSPPTKIATVLKAYTEGDSFETSARRLCFEAINGSGSIDIDIQINAVSVKEIT